MTSFIHDLKPQTRFWGFYGPLNRFWLYGAETEARHGDDPTLTSETRRGIFKVRLPKDSLTHNHAFITQSGLTGGKRQVKGATRTRTTLISGIGDCL